MKAYLGVRLARVSEHLRLIASVLNYASEPKAIHDAIVTLEILLSTLRMYQHEWQVQLLRGSRAGLDPHEVGEESMGGIMRRD